MKRILIPALFLLFLFVSVPAWATIWMSTGGGSGNILTSGADADSTTTSSDSGLEVIGGTITLLRGCDNGEIPKWNETTDVWECGADSTGSGSLGSELASTTNDITTSNAGDVLTLAGVGESLSLDFTTGTANQVNITSGTAVDDLNFGTIALTSTGGFTGDLTGNADTATSLAADPDNCVTAGAAAGGIDAAGVAQACIDLVATYQPLDAELTTLAGLTEAQGSIIIGDATPAWSALAIGAVGSVLLSNGTTAAWDASPALDGADITGIVTAGITDGTIIEPDLNVDGVPPTDGDILTYDSTGTNFAWITPHAGTDVTADLEEETHASEHAVAAADTVFPADPNADAIMVWDDAPTGAIEFALIGTGLNFDGTTLTASATATKWNDIVNPTANDTISFGELSAALAWNMTTDIALDAFTIAFTNDIAETSAQRALVVSRPASAGTAALEALVAIDNASVGGAVTDGLIITSSGAGGIVDAIDVSGANITNAINIGAHPIVTTSNTISVAELILLDTMTGRTGADLSFVTGTAGATDTCAKWNVDGDLVDTGAACGGNTAFSDIGTPTAATTLTFDDTETVTFDSASDGEVFFTISLSAADLIADTTALLITAVDNDDVSYIPFLIQDDQDVTPDDLFKVDSAGNVTALGTLTTGGFTLVTADAGANAFFGFDDVAGQYENLTAAEALTIIGGAANDFDASGDVTIAAADISDQNAGTDITADLEEEGQINITVVTGNASGASEILFSTGANAVAWDATPAINCADCIFAADSIGTAALDDGADTATDGHYVRVDSVDQAGFTYDSPAEVLTAIAAVPLAGGTLTGQLVTDNLGIEFTESDTNPTCAQAGDFSIYADLSEGILKKCQDGTPSDLDAAGAFNALTAPTAATSLTFQDTETITFTSEETTGPFFTINLTGTTTAETTALLISSAANNDPNFQPLLIQDNSAGTPEDLLSLNYQGNLTIAGSLSTPDTDNGKVTFTPATALESLWSVGPNHDGIGDDNDPFEIRQSATPGSSVKASLSTAGILSLNGLLDLADDGMTISSTSSTVTVESVVFTGGALTGVTNITTDAAEINGSITLANDDTISNGTNNQFAFAANGAEDLVLDLGTTANVAAFSSTTGVTQINLGAINLVATGYVDAGNCVQTPTVASQAVASLCANSGLFYNGDNDAITFTLPADPSSKIYCFNGDTFAQIMTITPGSGDTITLNGVTAAADESILSAGTVPESICLVGRSTSRWVSQGVTGTWAEATPP